MVRNSQFFDSLIRRRKLCEVEHNLAVIEIAFASNLHMTQRPFIALGLALLLVFIGGCASHKPAPHVAADLTSPKAAALTFLRAISAGDVQTAKSACIGTEREKASVEALSTLITGLRAYDQAVNTRFGVEAAQTDAQLKQAISDLLDVSITHAENAMVHEGPQTATVEPAAGGVRLRARPAIYLRKDQNHWKVDLATTAQADKRFDPETSQQYAVAGNALHQAADKINAGRYKSLAEAQRDANANVP